MISLAGGQPNDPELTNMFMYKHSQPHHQHWRNEALSVNDCFFRNMDEYKYIVNIDNDEMILSLNHTNWVSMMEDLQEETKNMVLWGSSSHISNLFIIFSLWAVGLSAMPSSLK